MTPPSENIRVKLCWVVVSIAGWGCILNFRPLGPHFITCLDGGWVVGGGGWWWLDKARKRTNSVQSIGIELRLIGTELGNKGRNDAEACVNVNVHKIFKNEIQQKYQHCKMYLLGRIMFMVHIDKLSFSFNFNFNLAELSLFSADPASHPATQPPTHPPGLLV